MRYLREEDYLIAEKNGISRVRAYQRVYIHSWDIDRAITEPIFNNRLKNKEKELNKVLEENGISLSTYYRRIRLGWLEDSAMKVPAYEIKNGYVKKYSDKDIKDAEANGIKRSTFVARVNNGWSLEEAKTKKTDTRFRKKDN